jgi:hypothetical protein
MTAIINIYIKPNLPFLGALLLFFLGMEFSFSFIFILSGLVFFLLRNHNRDFKAWLLVGFLVRISVALLDHYYGLTHYEWDDYYYIAMQLKTNLLHGVPLFNGVRESVHGLAYSVIGAFIYYIFGDYQILMRIVNAFLGTLVADRVYSLTMEMTADKKAAGTAALITLFFPSFIMFCSLDMRDAVIFFLTAEMLYRIALMMREKSAKNTLLLSMEIVALYFLRTQYLILFITIGSLYWFLRSNLYKNPVQRYALISVLVFLIWVGYRYLQDMGFFPVLFSSVNADMAWRTAGGSAYLVGVNYESWWDVFRWMPLRMIHFALGPFPWTVKNSFMLLACIESMALVVILFMAFTADARRLYSRHARLYLFLFLFALVGLVSSAVIDSNYGTAMRHKMNFIFIFFIFSSAFLRNLRIRIE